MRRECSVGWSSSQLPRIRILRFHASAAYFSFTNRSTRFPGISSNASTAFQARFMASLMSFAGRFRFVRKSLCARRRRYCGCWEGIGSNCSSSARSRLSRKRTVKKGGNGVCGVANYRRIFTPCSVRSVWPWIRTLPSSREFSALRVPVHDERVGFGDVRKRQVAANFENERVIQTARPLQDRPAAAATAQHRDAQHFAGIEVHFCAASVRITEDDEVLARLPKAKDFVGRPFFARIGGAPRRPRDSLAECAEFGLSIS